MAETLPEQEAGQARRRGLTAIGLAVLLAGAGYGMWHWLAGRHLEHTDNAYVAGNVVQITAQQPGTVVAIQADDTDYVRTGHLLLRLDDVDARLALEQAEAQLARSVREVRHVFANNSTLQAQLRSREAEVARAQADLIRAQEDTARRSGLVASGAIGREELEHAQAQVKVAQASVAAAQAALLTGREQLSAGRTQTEGLSVADHPAVQAAATKVREAHLALQRTQLLAPLDGHVAKRGVQIGQRVQAGAPLMTVVALDKVWVDANFKESQLQTLHIGQPATLTADVYGKEVVFHGTVAGLGAGTGAAFALLPAQNATGNWIKVVQRVPVRIALDPAELAAHPLRVGLSMTVVVDTADQRGKTLADAPRSTPVVATEVFAAQQKAADEDVRRVIARALAGRAS
ncbi:efflux RND transporter periplasmic adaptor subunit [Ideonella livida]|uniref:HlyD family efflux transporter periplasmic adaptor subunit n=1 Tax=Ideonella livida TaxID=2707176 RepID=A0A7C9PKJ2_9BURK|nr:efflux RND transporter periplasmic adaptor subunit [Ideonella livida]NDY93352.1 HlyD family efflux transporter periplasmic adaptor subunit [Ideonella livida]